MMVGADDPFVTAADRAAFEVEMREAGADWQMLIFGGVYHSYTSPKVDALNMPGLHYSESADRRSWAAMLALFEEIF